MSAQEQPDQWVLAQLDAMIKTIKESLLRVENEIHLLRRELKEEVRDMEGRVVDLEHARYRAEGAIGAVRWLFAAAVGSTLISVGSAIAVFINHGPIGR